MFDLAFHKPTGDWLFSPNVDLTSIRGDDVIKQRIYLRCRIPRGWINDPSNGRLGSRLRQATRGARSKAMIEIPLFIQEALDPMPDINVTGVEVREITNTSVLAMISYTVFDPGDPRPLPTQVSETAIVELPI